MKEVIIQEWTESERGWGTRPDGCTIHKTISDRHEFVKKYWSKMPKEIPDEYSRPEGEPREVVISDELYKNFEGVKFGFWLTQNDFREKKDKREILFIE